jgi:hypothetical protein
MSGYNMSGVKFLLNHIVVLENMTFFLLGDYYRFWSKFFLL